MNYIKISNWTWITLKLDARSLAARRGERHTSFYPSWFSKRYHPAIWCFKGTPLIVSSSNRNFYRAFSAPNFCILWRMNSIYEPLFAHEGEKGADECLLSSGVPRFLMSCRDRGRKVDGNFISIIVALAPRSLHTREKWVLRKGWRGM